MNESLKIQNIKPYARTIALAGGTGGGKSSAVLHFTSGKAKDILDNIRGEAKTTLEERKYVFYAPGSNPTKEDFIENTILVGTKMKDNIITGMSDWLNPAVIKAVKAYKTKGLAPKKAFSEALEEELNPKENTKGESSLLSEQDRSDLVDFLAEAFAETNFFENYSNSIYNEAEAELNEKKKELDKKEVKQYPSIDPFMSRHIEEHINEHLLSKVKEAAAMMEGSLKKTFFKYFDEENKSSDGYYFKAIDLGCYDKKEDTEDNRFVSAIFSSNDTSRNEKVSLEVLCKELFIYVPMNEKVVDYILESESSKNTFLDKNGNIRLGVYDTKGVYHESGDDQYQRDYFRYLVNKIDCDALALIRPVSGDTNKKDMDRFITTTLSEYKKHTPLFVLHNKIDKMISEMESSNDFSETDFDADPDEEEENAIILDAVNKEIKEFETQIKTDKQKIVSIPCVFTVARSNRKKLQDHFPDWIPPNFIYRIIDEMSRAVPSHRIGFELDEMDSDMEFAIDSNKVEAIIKERILDPEVKNTILNPAALNARESSRETLKMEPLNDKELISYPFIKINPHGNGYNALYRNLQSGYGHLSNIDTTYFVTVNPFFISFPQQTQGFLDKETISRLLKETIVYKGGNFTEDGQEKFEEYLNNTFRKSVFASTLFFTHAMLNKNNEWYGAKRGFDEFRTISNSYLSQPVEYIWYYTDSVAEAVKETLRNAIERKIFLS